jgi:hypothetical protein
VQSSLPWEAHAVASSKFIAGLIGPVLMVLGLSMLLNRGTFRTIVEQFAQSYALIFLAGLLALVAGLAVIRTHNIWTRDWRVIVTIFGWLAVVGGLLRILFPGEIAVIAISISDNQWILTIAALIPLGLGAFLFIMAYGEG